MTHHPLLAPRHAEIQTVPGTSAVRIPVPGTVLVRRGYLCRNSKNEKSSES